MNHNKIMIYPKLERFYVGEGIKLPNFLTVENQIDKPVGRFSYEFDLPAGVLFTHDKVWPAQLRVPMDSVRKGDRIIYRFRSSVALDKFLIYCRYGFGPFYFHVEKGTRIPPENSYVVFRTFYNDKEALAVRRELSVLKMPAIVPPKKLDISMWWEDRYMEAAHYPDSFRRSGFTTSMFFPRKVSDMTGRKALYSRMEKEKFKIRLELEPTNRMRFRYPNVTEFRCVGSEKKAGNICLAYRGKYYKESVDEIRQIMKQREVYAVTFDIENWEPHNMNASMRCSRCIALKEKKGYKSFVEYFEKEQASFVQGYAQAVRQGAREGGHKVPYIGFYAASPFFAYRCEEGPVSFLGYKYIFGKYCDEVQYSYYGRSSIECHKKMREVFRKSPFRARRIPWLTAGTGAYYSDPYSYRNEQHVVETLMNGAVGIQFYSRKSFESPLDYYYVAKGIGALSPYEDFLFNGTLEESLKGNNPNLCYTARRLGKEVLLLVGNYESRKPADSVICFPGKIRSVKFISGKGKASSKGANLAVNAGSDSFILVKVTLQ